MSNVTIFTPSTLPESPGKPGNLFIRLDKANIAFSSAFAAELSLCADDKIQITKVENEFYIIKSTEADGFACRGKNKNNMIVSNHIMAGILAQAFDIDTLLEYKMKSFRLQITKKHISELSVHLLLADITFCYQIVPPRKFETLK